LNAFFQFVYIYIHLLLNCPSFPHFFDIDNKQVTQTWAPTQMHHHHSYHGLRRHAYDLQLSHGKQAGNLTSVLRLCMRQARLTLPATSISSSRRSNPLDPLNPAVSATSCARRSFPTVRRNLYISTALREGMLVWLALVRLSCCSVLRLSWFRSLRTR
jgi:hypothetical protein